ncbi:MAG TPA: hypothetical protein VKA05_01540, partial [Acidimicrobiales bacterium]|nr:hypothetical protein [Acidimicrobiales bacterium]
ATGTHSQDGALTQAFTNGTFSALGVRAMLTLPSQLVGPAASPSTAGFGVGPGAPIRRWFGRRVDVGGLVLRTTGLTGPASLRSLAASVRLLGPGGAVLPTPARIRLTAGGVSLGLPQPVPAFGISLGGAGTPALAIAEPVVRAGDGTSFATDGPLASPVGAGGWVEVEGVGGFSAFVDRTAAAPFTLASPGSSWKVISSDEWTGAVSVRVTTPQPTSLVRSMAAVPGWEATVVHDGRSSAVAVRRHGLVQQVDVPAGVSTVTFAYVAPGWSGGQLAALAGTLVMLVLLAVDLAARRRTRPPEISGDAAPYRGPG